MSGRHVVLVPHLDRGFMSLLLLPLLVLIRRLGFFGPVVHESVTDLTGEDKLLRAGPLLGALVGQCGIFSHDFFRYWAMIGKLEMINCAGNKCG